MPPIRIDVRSADDLRDVVHRAVQALVEGELVAFPTETIYGIAASACNPNAVDKLLDLKQRRPESPFTLAIKSAEEARDFAPEMSPLAWRLARRSWPGPVTLVVDCDTDRSLTRQLSPAVQQSVCPTGTVGLRVPANKVLLDVLGMITGPLLLTSANSRGEPEAVTADEVIEYVGEKIALVLDDGPARYGRPSTVVRVEGDHFQVLREGVVSESTLQGLSRYMVVMVCTGNTCRSPMAELLLRKALAEQLGTSLDEVESHGVTLLSAGVAAAAGSPPSGEATEVMKTEGLALSQHRSQPLTEQLLRHADLLITMTRSHLTAITQSFPEVACRTKLLMPDGEDVADPIGGPLEVYRLCASQISAGVARHAEQIAGELRKRG